MSTHAPPGTSGADVLTACIRLTAYNADLAARSTAATARSWTNLWTSALTERRTPAELAVRTALWWTTALDRSPPRWHRPGSVVLTTPYARLRDVTAEGGHDDDVVPTLVLPPQAGHSSHVVDFSPRQSQLDVIADSGLTRLYALEWRPAVAATRDVTITDYLDVIDRSIVLAGGRANLVGDCQGGWLAAIYAALHPDRVNTLTLAGAPIDFHAGESVIAWSTRALTATLGMAPYHALVAAGGGNMPGSAVLANFVMIQPQAEISRQLQLLENIDDDAHVARYSVFEDWFKHTQDIPGAFYLWLVEHLFHRNELITGDLVVDGRPVDLGAITCPLLLLAGEADHITPPAQLFAAAEAVGTPPELVTRRTAAGGHLGLFMGRDALREDWPALMAEVLRHSGGDAPVPDHGARPDGSPRLPAP